MAKLITLFVGVWLFFGLAGCATQSEDMHATQIGPEGTSLDRVSSLRRLVLLPINYEIDGDVSEEWSQEAEAKKAQEAVINYLENWRGYLVKPTCSQQAEGSFSAEELRVRLLDQLSSSGKETKLPVETLDTIQKIARAYDADGVLVLKLRYEGLDTKRWAAVYGITFVTMGIGQYFYLFTLGTHYSAAIFDAKDGELVWYAQSNAVSWSHPVPGDYVGSMAFATLPNALPQVMFDKP